MVFGLGKKKEEAAPAAQMSPEAMAMLTQMAQQGGGAQAAPMAPSMPPAGAAPDQQMPAGTVMPGPPAGMASAGSANSNLTKKEQRRLARDQKKAAVPRHNPEPAPPGSRPG